MQSDTILKILTGPPEFAEMEAGLVKSGAREPGATWLARGATDSLTVGARRATVIFWYRLYAYWHDWSPFKTNTLTI